MRFVLPFLSLVAVITVAISFAGILANRAGEGAPGFLEEESVRDEIVVQWAEPSGARIQASSAGDAYFAMGYHDAVRRGFLCVLLREVSLGRASVWLGADLLDIDSFVRRAGIVERATAGLNSLDSATRVILDAYSRGFNAGFESANVERTPEFVLSGAQRGDAWRPVHSLAIEQLLSLLSAQVHAQTSGPATVPDVVRGRIGAISATVGFGDFGHSFLAGTSTEDVTAIRFVTGSLSGGGMAPIVVRLPDNLVVLMAMPGLPLPLAGVRSDRKWLALPQGKIETVDSIDGSVTRSFRLVDADGRERMSVVRTDSSGAVWQEPPGSPGGSVSARWTGPNESMVGWLHEMAFGTSVPSPTGHTAVVVTDTSDLVYGDFKKSTEGAVTFASADAHAADVAARLDELVSVDRLPLDEALDDDYSPFARRILENLLGDLDTVGDTAANESLQYLLNWDYTFGPASIGASIYDALASCPELTHSVAVGVSSSNSVFTRCLSSATVRLSAAAGDDQSRWRWELLQGAKIFSPLGAIIERRDGQTPTALKYAAVPLRSGGHPTTLRWGSSSSTSASVSVDMWCYADVLSCTIRSTYVDFDRAMGRFSTTRQTFRAADPIDERSTRITRIVPARTDERVSSRAPATRLPTEWIPG